MQWWIQLLEIASKLGILVGGGIGIYLAWMRVTAANRQAEAQIRQAEVQRRNYVTELFSSAVGQLRDEKLEVRLFAIYNLRQIAIDHPDYARAVIELLSAYVRENPQRWGEGEPPLDVREIFRFLESKLKQDQ
jgi:hypothetical protein